MEKLFRSFLGLAFLLVITGLFSVSSACAAPGKGEVYTFEAKLKRQFIKTLIKATRTKRLAAFPRASAQFSKRFEKSLKRRLQKNGLKVIGGRGSSTLILEAHHMPRRLRFMRSLNLLSHLVYTAPAQTNFETSQDRNGSGISSRSHQQCPSVPNPVECNGYTDDPRGSWALSPTTGMNVKDAWEKSTGGNVIVAVLSTGTKLDHPDLVGNLWSDSSTTFASGESLHGFNSYADAPPDDSSGTGTALAGIVAGTADNSIGLAGIAYSSKIMTVKAFDEQNLSKEKVIASFNYVIKKKEEGHNIRVVLSPNFYFGYSPGFEPAFISIAAELERLGILLVANVSQFNSDPTLNIDGGYNGFKYFPMNFERGNILISSSYSHGDFNNLFSAPVYGDTQNVGPQTVHLSSPGDYIYAPTATGGYSYWSGGGISAATAAGAAALLFAREPGLSPSEVVASLTNNTRPYPAFNGKTISEGALDVGNAMDAVSPDQNPPGDYTGDGCVDDNDYVAWKQAFGSTVAPGAGADGNKNGVVDASDYTIWRDYRGAGC